VKKITVVKFGGSLSKNEDAKKKFLKELAALAKKEAVVLVHGGGPEINAWLSRLNIESRFVKGLRYTDEAALEVVEMVLSGKVNKALVGALNRLGVKAVGISGKDGKIALCKRLKDLGFVGEPSKVDVGLVAVLLKSGFLPVISSLGFDATGQTLNINADSLAMGIAQGVKAHRLILLTDVPGVLDAEKKTITQIKISDAATLVKNGVITGGMIPKIKACCSAITTGVKEVWIADGTAGLSKLRGTVICKK
jgi:acetylglutamate kinase